MKTIKVHKIAKWLVYHYANEPGSGYSFAIDSDGRLVLTDANRANYYKARLAAKHGDMICDGIVEVVSTVIYHVVTCPVCGRKVYLYAGFCGACECGAAYDEYGILIADKDGKIDYDESYDPADYY